MLLPNFLCIGAAKAGTTTLYEILIQHQDIYLPKIKEPHFFDYEENYQQGVKWYSKHFFEGHQGEKAVGEITPSYLYIEKVAKRICFDLGKDIKLIILLRNPVDRAYSHYIFNVKRGFESFSFHDVMNTVNEEERISKGFVEKLRYSYISRGLYANQIKRFLEYFPMDNMKMILFEEDFIRNRDNTLSAIQRFLNINEITLNTDIKSNKASISRNEYIKDMLYKKSKLRKIAKLFLPSMELRHRVKNFLKRVNEKPYKPQELPIHIRKNVMEKHFKGDIHRLEDLIKRDLSYWYNI